MKEQNLILHPDAHWVKVDQDRVQLRQPDGEYITFDKHADDIINALIALSATSTNDIEIDESISNQIKDILKARGLLVDKYTEKQYQIQRLINQHGISGGKVYPGKNPTTVSIIGDGKLSDLVEEALVNAGIEIVGNDDFKKTSSKPPLLLAICDTDDHTFLKKINGIGIQNNQPILFFRWVQSGFKLGPFVVPGETACLDCVNQREIASSLFPDELKAYKSSNLSNLPNYEGGPVLDDLAKALITRHVITILNGNYDLSEPATIITINPVHLDIKHSPVIRLARCQTCSDLNEAPLRALRDQL